MNSTDIVPVDLTLPRVEPITVEIDLTAFNDISRTLIEQAERAEIKDADDYAKGGDLIKIANTQAKKAESARTDVTGPINQFLKLINATFKGPANEFAKVGSTIKPKMLAWKKTEDERIRKEAAIVAARLEEEALAKAALETESEDVDAVLDAAADASEKMVETASVGLQRGNYGSSTGTQVVYSTRVTDMVLFLDGLLEHIKNGNKRNIELAAIVDFRKSGLNTLAKDMRKQGVKTMPGAEFEETENIRVY